MAPTIAGRTRTRSTASNPIRHTHPNTRSLFSTTKKDRRTIKHSALISRIEKSKPSIQKRRRRPSKKLVTNLNSLAEALPDSLPAGKAEAAETATATTKITHKSLKSRPGAMKKKEKIITMEMDRFNKNMAQMAIMQPSGGTAHNGQQPEDADHALQTGARWAALRSFIQQTMEQRP
ncbi:MAG: hypothetical protein Q9185_005803 [Variospora sp. 1 TL-2023]